MNELAIFAGAGGGILGGKLLGWRTVCAVEWDPYAAGVLVARQNDKILEPFPIWDDVRTFDGKSWRGIVDVVSGGFPCQDISVAGKGAGIDGERSGMWKHMARIICEIRPNFVFVENSPMLVSRGLAVVLADFAKMGFDARWGIVGAHHAGAPHKRDRIWIVASAHSERQQELYAPSVASPSRQPDRSAAKGAQGCEGGAVAYSDSLRELQPEGGERHQRRWVSNGGEDVAYSNRDNEQRRRGAVQVGREWCKSKDGNDGDAGRTQWPAEPDVG